MVGGVHLFNFFFPIVNNACYVTSSLFISKLRHLDKKILLYENSSPVYFVTYNNSTG